jgi:predicted nucleic acid-binding protein
MNAATAKMKDIEGLGEPVSTAAPCVTEILVGAHFKGGPVLKDTVDLFSRLEVLEIDARVAQEAGSLGGELLRRGHPLATTDLLIAAAAKHHGHVLVTRDDDFHGIPGLALEGY